MIQNGEKREKCQWFNFSRGKAFGLVVLQHLCLRVFSVHCPALFQTNEFIGIQFRIIGAHLWLHICGHQFLFIWPFLTFFFPLCVVIPKFFTWSFSQYLINIYHHILKLKLGIVFAPFVHVTYCYYYGISFCSTPVISLQHFCSSGRF